MKNLDMIECRESLCIRDEIMKSYLTDNQIPQ
jgi:hypothetical protein